MFYIAKISISYLLSPCAYVSPSIPRPVCFLTKKVCFYQMVMISVEIKSTVNLYVKEYNIWNFLHKIFIFLIFMPLLIFCSSEGIHCALSFFWPKSCHIRTEYRDLQCKSLYWVQIQENTDQKKLHIWIFLMLWGFPCFSFFVKIAIYLRFLVLNIHIQTILRLIYHVNKVPSSFLLF